MKVLIADADLEVVARLRQTLTAGADTLVETASCGTDAWMILTTFHEGFDAAVVDFVLPDMHGIELLKKVRRQPRLQNLPVIVCTTIHDRGTVHDALALGVRDYLIKPAEPEAVLARLRHAISSGARER